MRARTVISLLALATLATMNPRAFAGEPCGIEGTGVLYVDDDAPPGGDGLTWETAFTDVQTALDAAPPFLNLLLIAGGTYTPNDTAGFIIPESLLVHGGFAGLSGPDPCEHDPALYPTILTGDLNGDDGPDFTNYEDNAGPVVTLSGGNIFDGITITSGYNPDGDGGGLLGAPNCSVTDCTILHCLANRGGGVRGAIGSGPYATYTGCTITDNLATTFGGGFAGPGALDHCYIARNQAAAGGGLDSFAGPITIEDSVIIANSTYSTEAWNAGGAATIQSATFINCTIVGNSAPEGDHGGILANNLKLYNCIVWDNRDRSGATLDSNIQTLGMDGFQMEHSFIQNWPPDFVDNLHPFFIEGTIGGDPGFQDAAGPDGVYGTLDDNLRLGAYSPCIDAGSEEFASLGGTDFEGLLRAFEVPSGNDIAIDMGAFEYQYDCDNNGTLDFIDLIEGDAPDCDGNGQPDSCQPQTDCNGNAVPDFCDFATGDSADCNHNAIPDACDIAMGTSTDLNNNTIPDECEPILLFVDQTATGVADGSSWPDAFTDLQDALDLAHAHPGPTDIWVAQGTYFPDRGTGAQNRSFILAGPLAVFGGFAGNETTLDQRNPEANPTTLTGDLASNDIVGDPDSRDDNAQHVVQAIASQTPALLDGFTITGGGTFANDEITLILNACFGTCHPDHWGGGMRIFGRGIALRNCVFDRNAANHWGGGAYMGIDSEATFESCAFRDAEPDTGAGGILNNQGDLTLIDCAFINNHSDPGYGGAVFNSGTVVATGTMFNANSSHAAGAVLTIGPASFLRCDFIENSGFQAGAIHAPTHYSSSFFAPPDQGQHNAPTRVAACRFVGNVATNGTIWDNRLRLRLTDSLFVANTNKYFTVFSQPNSTPFEDWETSITSCTFVSNTSETALVRTLIIPDVLPFIRVSNCLAHANVTPEGDPLPFHLAELHPPSSSLIEAPPEFDGVNGNIIATPIFTDPLGPDGIPATGDEDYTLAPGSPGIDAGSNLDLPADALDLDADGDTTEPLPLDLAGRPRTADDPATPDTGKGEAPIVDMGAFETVPPTLTCATDLDDDAFVGATDLNILIASFGCAGGACQGDIDGDGDTDSADLNLLLTAFGTACAP